MQDITLGIVCFLIAATLLFLLAYLYFDARKRKKGRATRTPAMANGPGAIRPREPSIALGQLRQTHAREQASWKAARDVLEAERKQHQRFDYATIGLEDLIGQMSEDERGNLGRVLGADRSASADVIANALCKAGTHSVRTVLGGAPRSYREVAKDAAEKIGTKGLTAATPVAQIEQRAVETMLTARLNSAAPEERAKLIAALGGTKGGTGIATTAGGLVVANLTGFALYTGASTALAATAGAFGLTLPFAVYTGMSSTIATLIGPVGWAGLAIFGIAKLGATNYKKTIPSVLAVAAGRARLAEEQREALLRLEVRTRQSDEHAARLEPMARFLRGHAGWTDDSQIPLSKVPP